MGLKSLKKRIKDEGIVIYPIDKSGKGSADTKSSYVKGMKEHLEHMEEVKIKE